MEKIKKYDPLFFIVRSQQVHGEKYDYSKTFYQNQSTPVKIVCPLHGEYFQKPVEHLRGKGCPTCSLKLVQSIKTESKITKQSAEDIISLVNLVQKEKEQVGFSVLDFNFNEFFYLGDTFTEAYCKFVADIFNQKFGDVNKKTIEAFGDTLQTSFDKFPNSYQKQKSSIKTIFEGRLYFHTNMNIGNLKNMVIKLTESLHSKVLFKDEVSKENHGMSLEQAINAKENNQQ